MRRILICLLLAGCATAEGYEAKLQEWVGASERELVEAWGVPDSTYETGGAKFLEYSRGAIYGTGWRTGFGYYGSNTFLGWSGPRVYTRQCETTFTLRDGKVTAWRYDGNDCRA